MNEIITEIDSNGNIAVDDMILINNFPTQAGSKMLEGYKPLFSAEAVKRLEDKGYVIAGKTNVGEFGLDLVGEFSYYGKQEGKLKGAAASLVAEGKVKAALGVDVNGSTRMAAVLSGVDFLKPTYGTVSRYGIISTAASGEQVGVYAGDVNVIKEVMEVIAGHDEKDGTSLRLYNAESKADTQTRQVEDPACHSEQRTNVHSTFAGCEESHNNDGILHYHTDADVKGKKVAIVKELLEKCDEETQKRLVTFAEKLKAAGVTVEEISCDFFENANTAWQILMTAETCNNLSRYDGVKYGHRADDYKNIDELYVNSRTEGFNFLTKAVILYGSDMLSKGRYDDCYGKALKVRRVIAEKFAELMKTYDALLTPACSKASYEAYDIKDAFEKVFEESVFTATANLIGVPALVSGGVQLLGDYFSESTLLSLVENIERR